jgi:hypothetical protein
LFKSALTAARDQVGQALAASLPLLRVEGLLLAEAAEAVIAAAGRGAAAQVLETNFAWREITSGAV